MRLLLLLLPVIALMVGLALGYRLGQRQSDTRLGKDEFAELEGLRSQRLKLISQASQHATLGDDFAVIALDELINHTPTPPTKRKRER